jgi:hypothetical protein
VSSNIIIHPGYSLENTDILLLKETSIKGSLSGEHAFDLVVAKQGKAVILKFKTPFQPSEKVTATFSPLLKNKQGTCIGNYELEYSISKYTESDRKRLLHNINNSPNNGQNDYPVNFDNDTESKNQTETYNQYAPAADGYIFITQSDIRRPDGSLVKDILATGNAFRRVNDTIIGLATHGGDVYLYNENYDFYHRYFRIRSSNGNGYGPNGHDFTITPDGNALFFCVDTLVMDLSAYPGGDTATFVRADVIQEIDKETGELVWVWNAIEYLKPWESTLISFNSVFLDYAHSNALSLDTDGNVVIGTFNMAEVTKIHYPSGGVIWRMGGKKNQFTFTNDSVGFGKHHHAVINENGHLTMFDNTRNRALEYTIDTVNKTVTKVWERLNPTAAVSSHYGSHQILPNGNHFISWGYVQTFNAHPVVSEVTPDGTVVFDIIKTSGAGGYYRAYKYTWKLANVSLGEGTEYLKTEGDVLPITVPVSLSRSSNCEVSLKMISSGTLSDADVMISPNTLAFQDTSQVVSKNFVIEVNDDMLFEQQEWAQFALTNVSGGCPLLNDTIVLRINDNERTTATLAQNTTVDEAVGNTSVSIALDEPRNCMLIATPDWANSSATPADIQITNDTLRFTDVSTNLTQSFTFGIVDDLIDEVQEVLLA